MWISDVSIRRPVFAVMVIAALVVLGWISLGRVGVDLTLDDFEIGSEIPLLVNCMPSGKYLMEDFCYAGGMPVILKELQHLLRPAKTVLDCDISTYAEGAECWNRDVIRSFDAPLKPAAGLRVLKGNLAPRGAIVKPSAATDALLEHEGEAYVFENIEELKATINSDDLPVTKDSILVLKGCGPKGYPGMAEVGNMGLPPKVLKRGITDMVRISDARMSGTAYGTVILHTSPEAAVGGPLAVVRNGDMIELDVAARTLHLHMPTEGRRVNLDNARLALLNSFDREQNEKQEYYDQRLAEITRRKLKPVRTAAKALNALSAFSTAAEDKARERGEEVPAFTL